MTGFSVAAIVNEPLPVLRRFVDWYMAQGADRIEVYFDDPTHPAISELATLQGVVVTPCTAEFWRALGTGPGERFTLRQNVVLTHAYHQTRSEWLLNVDADELMHFQGQRLPDLLAGLPPEVCSLRVATAEFVNGPGGLALFRLAVPRGIVNDAYGDKADLFRRRRGLLGHTKGKSFHRAGHRGIRLRQHWAVDAAGVEIPARELGPAEGCHLLHYLAPDYAAWRGKLEWRLGSSGFSDAVKAELDRLRQTASDPEAAYQALYQELHCIDADRKARLLAAGGLLELPAEFAPA
jgi:Glycosyl transferase family 2